MVHPINFYIADVEICEQTQAQVNALNLEPMILKLMGKKHKDKDGEGMKLQEAEAHAEQYRHFLTLAGSVPLNTPVVPWGNVDKVWHAHILDTEKYYKDCMSVFGTMLHNFPYFGMRGYNDGQHLLDQAQRTVELAIQHFGTVLMEDGSTYVNTVPEICTGGFCGAVITDNAEVNNDMLRTDVRPRFAAIGPQLG